LQDLEIQDDIHRSRKLGAALIAIVVNTALLKAADWIPLVTGRGGLLKLLKIYFASPLASLGVADFWAALHLPAADTRAFKTGFHIVVGLLMTVFYAFVLEPILSGSALVKGLVYALLVWLANVLRRAPLDRRGHRREPLFERGRHDLFRGSPQRLFRAAHAALRALHATKRGGERLSS
jgi:hypothetical protein